MIKATKIKYAIEKLDEEWPKGGAHVVTILGLTLLLDIRELLIKIAKK